MICPNCRENLKQTERPDHTCSRCHREFALDPQVEPGRLHDLKFRELVEKARGSGGLRITVEQLYWANERRLHRFPDAAARRGGLVAAVSLSTAALVSAGLALALRGPALWVFGLFAVVLGTMAFGQFGFATSAREDAPLYPVVREKSFRDTVLDRWRRVYRTLPDGLVEHLPELPGAPMVKARAVVLCTAEGMAAFLRLNRFEELHQVLLVEELAQVPTGTVPVVVLRDLSLAGLDSVARARDALPARRVVEAGLLPRSVFAPAKVVRLRDWHHDQPVPEHLAFSPDWRRLEPREQDWLTGGWHTPLATLPPPRVMALAEHAVRRALAPLDEAERRAERIGFLTWPQPPVPAPREATADTPSPRPLDGTP